MSAAYAGRGIRTRDLWSEQLSAHIRALLLVFIILQKVLTARRR